MRRQNGKILIETIELSDPELAEAKKEPTSVVSAKDGNKTKQTKTHLTKTQNTDFIMIYNQSI